MSESVVTQKIYYIQEHLGYISCYVEHHNSLVFSWCEPKIRAEKKMKHLTVVYSIENKGIWDGIYIRNGDIENLSFLFMLKITARLGVEHCLSKVAPPDNARINVFMSLEENGIVTFYKGSGGFLGIVGTYTEEQFSAMRKYYTYCCLTPDIGLYLRNNHLVRLTRDKIKNDARKKETLTITV